MSMSVSVNMNVNMSAGAFQAKAKRMLRAPSPHRMFAMAVACAAFFLPLLEFPITNQQESVLVCLDTSSRVYCLSEAPMVPRESERLRVAMPASGGLAGGWLLAAGCARRSPRRGSPCLASSSIEG